MLWQALAEKTLEAAARHAFPSTAPAPPPPVWARVDCVMRGDQALLMELELIEPVLFLDSSPGIICVILVTHLIFIHFSFIQLDSLAGSADLLARAIHQRVRASSLPPRQEQRHSTEGRDRHDSRLGDSHGNAYKRSRND